MNYTYKKISDPSKEEIKNAILRKEDNAIIPFDEANSDYQEYLEWAKTNTAEAAD